VATESAIKYLDILDELAATMAASLIEDGIAPARAHAAADKAAERVQMEYGGGPPIYFPKGLGYKLAKRNVEIRRRLAAGEPRDVIRRDFNLTDERLRQIEADERQSRRP
jgi:Mor family transcriptional regulator